MDDERLQALPSEMLSFTIISALARSTPRLGRLAHQGRKDILTPGYIATTSRGAISHITPDVQAQHTAVGGVYMAAEDFIEKYKTRDPAVFQIPPLPRISRLRRFTAQPDDALLIMGPRRPEPIDAPMKNSNDGFTICTSVGFRRETSAAYTSAVGVMGPDIIIGPADIVWEVTKSQKRIEKMSDRTERWMEQVFHTSWPENRPALYAPVLNVEARQQRLYLDGLAEHKDQIAGLAIYDPIALHEFPDALAHLPKLSLSPPAAPHDILTQISQGIDIFTVPFITQASDAGIALTFTFPASSTSDITTPTPLGIDMFLPSHAQSNIPISSSCTCNACQTASRAYIQHLLSAKEMTGWILLQIHNHAVISSFFDNIRGSIAAGTFDDDCKAFETFYEKLLPSQSGAGPRVRGYQYKSEGPHEKKRNPRAFRSDLGAALTAESGKGEALVEGVAESVGAGAVTDAQELGEHGLGQPIG